MTVRSFRSFRAVALLATAALAAAACTGAGDDDDDAASPSPTPVFVADGCQIVWVNRADPGGSTADVYVVDAPVSTWVIGTHQYGTAASGRFYKGYVLETGAWESSALASNGSFALTAASTTAGNVVRFQDTTPQDYLLLDSAGNPIAIAGTGGTGTFEALLSDPFSANVTGGSGTLQIAIQGTSYELGQDLSYAVCYEGSSPLRPLSGNVPGRAGGDGNTP